jgi:flavin reductase (DIM6/NTAB) family NADH-FMN oxidoreductase RutF
MEPRFEPVDPALIDSSPFRLIGDEWMLVSSAHGGKANMMTASWGGLGVLWNKKAATCYVRPTRHTYGLIEDSGSFGLSFLGKGHRKALQYLGTASGRDVDKIAVSGLSPLGFEPGSLPSAWDGGAPYLGFREAELFMACKVIYAFDIDPARFMAPGIEAFYPEKDYHRAYIGEIVGCWRRA